MRNAENVVHSNTVRNVWSVCCCTTENAVRRGSVHAVITLPCARRRTGTYYAAILENRADFEGKVVGDIGAGSGILSLFAAQARPLHAPFSAASAHSGASWHRLRCTCNSWAISINMGFIGLPVGCKHVSTAKDS